MEKENIIELLENMQQTYALLFALINKVQGQADIAINQVTSRQHMTLVAIMQLKNQQATVSRIASRLSTSKQTASLLIKELQKKGLVSIEKSSLDKRSIHVSLTILGESMLLETLPSSNRFLATLFHIFDLSTLKQLQSMLVNLYAFDGQQYEPFKETNTKTDIEFLNQRNEFWEQQLLIDFYQHYLDTRNE